METKTYDMKRQPQANWCVVTTDVGVTMTYVSRCSVLFSENTTRTPGTPDRNRKHFFPPGNANTSLSVLVQAAICTEFKWVLIKNTPNSKLLWYRYHPCFFAWGCLCHISLCLCLGGHLLSFSFGAELLREFLGQKDTCDIFAFAIFTDCVRSSLILPQRWSLKTNYFVWIHSDWGNHHLKCFSFNSIYLTYHFTWLIYNVPKTINLKKHSKLRL